MLRIAGVAALLLSLGQGPASAQFSDCASMANPAARLECYDRRQGVPPTARQLSPAPAPVPLTGGSCTRSSPCVGPRGGVYYFSSSGRKQYLPR